MHCHQSARPVVACRLHVHRGGRRCRCRRLGSGRHDGRHAGYWALISGGDARGVARRLDRCRLRSVVGHDVFCRGAAQWRIRRLLADGFCNTHAHTHTVPSPYDTRQSHTPSITYMYTSIYIYSSCCSHRQGCNNYYQLMTEANCCPAPPFHPPTSASHLKVRTPHGRNRREGLRYR